MSADNGIYIIKDQMGFRITEAQAIENLWWWGDDGNEGKKDEICPDRVEEYFGKSPYIPTLAEAYAEAEMLAEKILNSSCSYLEYGIRYLGEI